jgi:hypothetical protein
MLRLQNSHIGIFEGVYSDRYWERCWRLALSCDILAHGLVHTLLRGRKPGPILRRKFPVRLHLDHAVIMM